jgi:hypothetical protein
VGTLAAAYDTVDSVAGLLLLDAWSPVCYYYSWRGTVAERQPIEIESATDSAEVSTMSTVTEREQRDEADKVGAMVRNFQATHGIFGRYSQPPTQFAYVRHLVDDHGIPDRIATKLTYPQALGLCYDDQAQDLEDYRR